MTRHLVRILGRSIPLAVLVTLFAARAAAAQGPTGRLEGHVRDATGQPVAAARIIVVGTPYAATTDRAGRYTFRPLPAGNYDLRASNVGYRPVEIRGVRILVGHTTTQDFVLEQAAVEIQEITVVAAQNALVPRDQVTSRQLVDGSYTDRLPVDNLSNVFATAPGVMASPGNTVSSVRGARTDPGNTYVAGVPILSTSPNTFEGAAITSGATAAEFGNAQGGVISVSRDSAGAAVQPPARILNTEAYDRIIENPFLAARFNPLSTFGVDVDRASYSNVRRFIENGQRPPADAVRIEELVNYFSYDNPAPDARSEHPFTVTTEVAVAPWKPEHRLVRIALQGRRVDVADLPPANLVFLLDVSGSMRAPNKLPLVKQSMRLLVEQLRPEDRVAMVVYAGAAGLVLPSTPARERDAIVAAIDRLEAGGSTAGGAGIRLAYQVAREHKITGGNNRVILATDGDFNVGASSDAEMERLIEAERQHGIFLTVLGFGMGNYKDSKLEKLADKGNGNYAYIDGLQEARKTLVSEFGGTLLTIATDVKLQVEFNPARVQGYRLIGYENRMLRAEDFNDDTRDAGEIGAGLAVTALYEIVPVGARTSAMIRGIDSLRYQETPGGGSAANRELLHVKIRYKAPDGDTSRLLSHPVPDRVRRASTELRFAGAVAAFGMLLRGSEHAGSATLDDVLASARGALGPDRDGTRAGFVALVERYRALTAPMADD